MTSARTLRQRTKIAVRAFQAFLLAACFAACQSAPSTAPRPPNVLLIVVDTLRWDHLGCYGYERDTTPAIDRLAARAVRFHRAYATAPWTIPSVASMITGRYPSNHTAISFDRSLPDGVDTLAEILEREDYATAGVISHRAIGSSHNFQQGFDVYLESEARGHDHVSTEGVTRQAVDLLETLSAAGQPFFLFVHYFDPHYNYKRHPEYGFAGPSAGRLDGAQAMPELLRMAHDMTPQEVQFLRDLYDEEIRHTDAGIGSLLDRLDALGLREDTVVVFTADHGEEFLGHGNLGHTRTLYDELVRVPLIVDLPRRDASAHVVDRPVSLVSLTPTLLDLIGLDGSAHGFQGESVAPLLSGERSSPASPLLCEVDFEPIRPGRLIGRVHKKATVGERYKLIRDDTTGHIELYDLTSDPHEARDIYEDGLALGNRLLETLERSLVLARKGAADPRERMPDEAEIDRLRSLGYVGAD